MFWIADVFTGTRSQVWGKGYVGGDRVEKHGYIEPPKPRPSAIRRAWRWLTATLVAAHERRLAIRDLHRLNDQMLRDIGITRFEIEAYVRNAERRQSSKSESREVHSVFERRSSEIVAVERESYGPILDRQADGCASASDSMANGRRAA